MSFELTSCSNIEHWFNIVTLFHATKDIDIHYDDITQRNNNSVPEADPYIAGLVCTPMSKLGKKKGLADPRGRTWRSSIDYIRKRHQKAIVIENVPDVGIIGTANESPTESRGPPACFTSHSCASTCSANTLSVINA